MKLSCIKLFSILIVIGLSILFERRPFTLFYLNLGVAHVLISFYFSGRYISSNILFISQSKDKKIKDYFLHSWKLIALIFAGLYFAYDSNPEYWLQGLFGIHFVFSEVYFFNKYYSAISIKYSSLLSFSRIAFHFLIYFYLCLPRFYRVDIFSSNILLLLASIFIGINIIIFYMNRREMHRSMFYDMIVFDLLSLIVIIGVNYSLAIMYVASYHFTIWIFFPLISFLKNYAKERNHYFAVHLVTIIFMLAWPGFSLPILKYQKEGIVFTLVNMIHITTSLSLSRLNPSWVNNIFQRSKASS